MSDSPQCRTCKYFKYGVGGQAKGYCSEPGKIVWQGQQPVTKPPAVAPLHHCIAHRSRE